MFIFRKIWLRQAGAHVSAIYGPSGDEERRVGDAQHSPSHNAARCLVNSRWLAYKIGLKDRLWTAARYGTKPFRAAFVCVGEIAMRLLVVEDQEDCAFVLARRLQMQGHEVRICNNACSALLAAPEFEPDAVLLDIGLPEMDGWQLAPLLRDSLADRRVQLIAISGFQTENDFMRSRAAGIDYHLPKPNYFDRLSQILRAQAH